MESEKEKEFISFIWDFYAQNKRDFLWRQDTTPYTILVSEIMLQQTQVSRVSEKLPHFLAGFPDFDTLAAADLTDVLVAWQGMGYNRRAKYLHEIAKMVVRDFGSTLPHNPQILETLPGIGPNTAGSLTAFAYNIPTVFIETNIRRVYLHHFFPKKSDVSDKELLKIIAKTVDQTNPREWYWALMDYGSYLKTQLPNPNRRSKHYTKQSQFEGSNRQVRSKILSLILEHKQLSIDSLSQYFDPQELRIHTNLLALQKEGFITLQNDIISTAN
jgi:A/G-specific adenine glycosylase